MPLANLKNIILYFLLIVSFGSYAQEPFSSIMIRKTKIKNQDFVDGTEYGSANFKKKPDVKKSGIKFKDLPNKENPDSSDSNDKPTTEDQQVDLEKEDKPTNLNDSTLIDIFSSSSSGIDLGADIAVPRVKIGFVYYKLGIYTSKEKTKEKTDSDGNKGIKVIPSKTFFLPLFFFSRITTDYDTLTSAPSIDGIDFDGAPITLRLMPSFNVKIGQENSLYTGLIMDYRGLNVVDENGSRFEHGMYLATGFRYTGQGMAYTSMADDEIKGKWSLSVIGSTFISKCETIDYLFDVDENQANVTSVQVFLSFKVLDKKNAHVNLNASFQRSFNDFAGNNTGDIFKISIGMKN